MVVALLNLVGKPVVWILFLIFPEIECYQLCIGFQAKLATQVNLTHSIQTTMLMVLYFIQVLEGNCIVDFTWG